MTTKTTKNQARRIIQRLRHVLPFMFVIVGMLALAGGVSVTKVFQQNATSPLSTPLPTPAPNSTYTSDKLGISFTYLTTVSGRVNFFTREISDTVYLYYNPATNQSFSGTDAEFLNTVPGHGYSVEVFNKDPKHSLTEAIKQQFLTGYNSSDCIVHATRYGHPRDNDSYQTVVIDYPHHSTDTRNQVESKIAKCPKNVTGFGVSYFMMDPKHPNKLLFVTLGQDNIPSGIWGKGTWDETLKVLN